MQVIVVQVMAMSHGHGGDGRNEVDGGDELKSCTSGVKHVSVQLLHADFHASCAWILC